MLAATLATVYYSVTLVEMVAMKLKTDEIFLVLTGQRLLSSLPERIKYARANEFLRFRVFVEKKVLLHLLG